MLAESRDVLLADAAKLSTGDIFEGFEESVGVEVLAGAVEESFGEGFEDRLGAAPRLEPDPKLHPEHFELIDDGQTAPAAS